MHVFISQKVQSPLHADFWYFKAALFFFEKFFIEKEVSVCAWMGVCAAGGMCESVCRFVYTGGCALCGCVCVRERERACVPARLPALEWKCSMELFPVMHIPPSTHAKGGKKSSTSFSQVCRTERPAPHFRTLNE